MHKYRLIGKKGEGTFSEVLKAQAIKNGKYMAIKCMKNHFDSLDQVNNLREIQALRRLSPHPGVIKLAEVLYDQPTGRLALVFELMEMNIYELIRGRRHYLPEAKIKGYMYQLLKSMDHMHRNGIFHRDIKPENILITDDELKLADFGSCRGIYSKQPYTEYISTRWYRAPECLLTDGFYNYKMDMWGVGCVFFEVMSLYPLFPGTNELDQVSKIHNVLGTPPKATLDKLKKHSNSHIDFNFPPKEGTPMQKLLPHSSAECVDLITKLLAYDADERISARQAVKHPAFKEFRALEKRAEAGQGQGASAGSGGEEELPVAANSSPPAAKPRRTTRDRLNNAPAQTSGDGSMLPTIMRGGVVGGNTGATGYTGSSCARSDSCKSGGGSDAEGSSSHHSSCNASCKMDPCGGHFCAQHSAGQSAALPDLHAHADGEGSSQDSGGLLPPIGLGGGGSFGGAGGFSGLKIDSKCLMQQPSTKQAKPQKKPGGTKKPSAARVPMQGFGATVQSRSLDKLGQDAFELGVSNSSTHHAGSSLTHPQQQPPQGSYQQYQMQSQQQHPHEHMPPMELDGVGLAKGMCKPKSYVSPYSQGPAQMQRSKRGAVGM